MWRLRLLALLNEIGQGGINQWEESLWYGALWRVVPFAHFTMLLLSFTSIYLTIGFVAESMGDLYTVSTAPMFWHEKLL